MRVLIIAHAWPPSPAIGAQRPYHLAKELLRAGHDVAVITSVDHPDDLQGRIRPDALLTALDAQESLVRHAYDNSGVDSRVHGSRQRLGVAALRLIPRGALRQIAPLAYWPDRQRRWASSVYEDAQSLVARWKPDIILSTSPPFSSHVLASRLSQHTGIPWAADLRDLWATQPRTGLRSLHSRFGLRLERQILPGAALITVASEQAGTQIQSAHALQVRVLLNGYDPDEFHLVEPMDLGASFNIVYTGALYYGISEGTLGMLLDALSRDSASNVQLHYFGRDGRSLLHLASGSAARQRVVDHGVVSREMSHSAQVSADLLVVLAPHFGSVTSKFFDYVASGSPTLVIGHDASELVVLANASGAALTASTSDAVHRVIEEVRHPGDPSERSSPSVDETLMHTWTREYSSRKWREELERAVATAATNPTRQRELP